jgi:hypothetical protein
VTRTITFGSDPVTTVAAVTALILQGSPYLTAYADATGQIVVTTVQQGSAAILECLGGDAAPYLGFESSGPLSLATGRNPRIPLASAVERYSFEDPYSSPTYVYKTRFSSSQTGVTSAFSDPIPGAGVAAVPGELLAVGFVRLINSAGRPLQGQLVTVHHDFLGLTAEEYTVSGAEQRKRTDATGLVEFALLRGLTVHVGIENTNLARKVVVPSNQAVVRFDLLDGAYGEDDLFTVRRQNLPYAIRT